MEYWSVSTSIKPHRYDNLNLTFRTTVCPCTATSHERRGCDRNGRSLIGSLHLLGVRRHVFYVRGRPRGGGEARGVAAGPYRGAGGLGSWVVVGVEVDPGTRGIAALQGCEVW